MYRKILYDVREILETLCKYKQVDIIAGTVCIDHVHLSVAIPPKLSVSQFMGYLKGKSILMIYNHIQSCKINRIRHFEGEVIMWKQSVI